MLIFLSRKIDIPLLLGYFKHILNLPVKFFSTRKTGDILTRFQDAKVVKNIITGMSISLVIDFVLAIITGVVLYLMSPYLFVVISLVMLANIGLVYIFKGTYKKINIQQVEENAILNSQMIESVTNVEVIKSFSYESAQLKALEEKFIATLKTSYREYVLKNIQFSLSRSLNVFGNMSLLIVGALSIMDSRMTIGDLMAFIGSVSILY